MFVPLFYYLGVPLAEATPTALLLNVVSLLFATINYWRGKLINWRVGLPVLIAAVILSPVGARLTQYVNKTVLLAMFAAFLVFAGAMMLFYKAKKREQALSRAGRNRCRCRCWYGGWFFGWSIGCGRREFHFAGAQLAGVGCQGGCRNNSAGRGFLLAVWISWSCHHERAGPVVCWDHGSDGCGRIDCGFTVDENKIIKHTA